VITLLFSFTIPSVSGGASIIISSYSLSPSVLMPGDEAILNLVITNGEATSSESVSYGSSPYDVATIVGMDGVEIERISINTIVSGGRLKPDTLYNDVTYLAPGVSLSVPFKLLCEEDMNDGVYLPKVSIDTDGAENDASLPVVVEVSSIGLEVEEHVVPNKISVGGSTQISLNLLNRRGASFDSISIVPESCEGLCISPSSVYVSSLEAHSSQEVLFDLEPSSIGEYSLNFSVEYYNGHNLHHTNASIFTEVVDTLDVSAVMYTMPSSLMKGSSDTIRLEVYNAKQTGISGVTIVPVTDDGSMVIPSEYFIGEMDADDVFSASFTLDSSSASVGNHTLGFKVIFKQGSDYYETPLKSYSYSVTNSVSSQSADLTTPIMIIGFLAIMVLGYLFLRERRKHK